MLLTQLRKIYDTPFFDLISRARASYLEHWSGNEVQLCTLLSIKTGGCSEDCGYCAQSSRYQTGVKAERLMPTEEVMAVGPGARGKGPTPLFLGGGREGGGGGGPPLLPGGGGGPGGGPPR